MKRFFGVLLLVSGLALAQQQGFSKSDLTPQMVRDVDAPTLPLAGTVAMVGASWPGPHLQRHILEVLRQKRITVRVLTVRPALTTLGPLRALGAEVRLLPQGAGIEDNAVISATLVIKAGGVQHTVFRSNLAASALQNRFEHWWQRAQRP